jgi:hypothetical protein
VHSGFTVFHHARSVGVCAGPDDFVRALTLEPLSTEREQQSWVVDGARIELALDTGLADFMLTIHRPGA